MATRLQNFLECVFQEKSPNVDRQAGIIRGVKILGRTSRNGGREYSDRALRDAAKIYEGLGVNVNHPDRSTPNATRNVEEGIGWLEGVKVKPDGVYGDLNVIRSHPLAGTLFEIAERKPDRFGLSHNASGDVVERNGRPLVESIKNVRSVDLVQNPATVKSLFESFDPEVPPTMKLKDLVRRTPAGKYRRALVALIESDAAPDVTGDTPVDAPATDDSDSSSASTPDTSDAEANAKAGLKTAIESLFDDDSLSLEDLLMQLATILQTEANELGIDLSAAAADASSAGSAADDSSSGDASMSESYVRRIRKLESQLVEASGERQARALLERAGLTVTDQRVKLLKGVNAATRMGLIEEWKAIPLQRSSRRPASSRPVPLVESRDGRSAPKTTDEFKRRVFG